MSMVEGEDKGMTAFESFLASGLKEFEARYLEKWLRDPTAANDPLGLFGPPATPCATATPPREGVSAPPQSAPKPKDPSVFALVPINPHPDGIHCGECYGLALGTAVCPWAIFDNKMPPGKRSAACLSPVPIKGA